MKSIKKWNRNIWYVIIFAAVNLFAVMVLYQKESGYIQRSLELHAEESLEQTDTVMQDYLHSFRLFTQMMTQIVESNPEPDAIWDYLKSIDSKMLEIEGDTFDGLYMYYKGHYLYSWDTPYSEYESTVYIATERPWYKDAAAGQGEIVFTPPYMSYANHYILSTISQLQPDKEAVFAYDIKMGNIQNLVSSLSAYDKEQLMIFDSNGTVIGSTDENYLGGNLTESLDATEQKVQDAKDALENAGDVTQTQKEKLTEEFESASAFCTFRQDFGTGFEKLSTSKKAAHVKIGSGNYFGYLLDGGDYNFLILVPVFSMLKSSLQIWLLPLLALELLLIYVLGRFSKEQKNRELKEAYVELGQTQRRLEIALNAAQKAAAIDDLTGMMNFKSFRRGIMDQLESMAPGEAGILIMIDGDHFKAVNDNYGHTMGDEVIKLSAQMIVGRIRTVDLASRLHGDEFAIFISKTEDYKVAERIMNDINSTLAAEALKRNMPSITMSAGAVIARHGDSYTALAKTADAALYRAKETHNGKFASAE